jgi:transposase
VCADRARKSVGAENTFAQDISDRDAAREALEHDFFRLGRFWDSGSVGYLIQDAGWVWRPVSMSAPYSLDLRERVVAAITGGMSRRQAAKVYQIGYATAIRWMERAQRTGNPAALPMGGKKPFSLADEADWIRARIADKPDITGRELLAELHARDVDVSYYGVWHFLDREELTFKKNAARQ